MKIDEWTITIVIITHVQSQNILAIFTQIHQTILSIETLL